MYKTKWGFYVKEGWILPFRNDNGFNEWYWYNRNEVGDIVGSVDITQTKRRTFYVLIKDYSKDRTFIFKTTTLRRAMIIGTNVFIWLWKGFSDSTILLRLRDRFKDQFEF